MIKINNWTYITDGLPIEKDRYLVSLSYGFVDIVDILEYFTEKEEKLEVYKPGFYSDDEEWGRSICNNVVAWMPLPLPYKERKKMTNEKAISELKFAIQISEKLKNDTYHDLLQAMKTAVDVMESDKWIPCTKRKPEAETIVQLLIDIPLINGNKYRFMTRGFYEDGNVKKDDSIYNWDWNPDPNIIRYDEETKVEYIRERWFEAGHYIKNFGIIRDFVVKWRPFPLSSFC